MVCREGGAWWWGRTTQPIQTILFNAFADVGEYFCSFFICVLIALHLTCIFKKYPVITLKDFKTWILEFVGGKKTTKSGVFQLKCCFSFTNFDDGANIVAVFQLCEPPLLKSSFVTCG